MNNRLSPLTLCAFVLADVRSDEAGTAFSIGNCRVYRLSMERLEILVPHELPYGLRDIKLTLHRGGMLALNLPATISRRVYFQDYLLIEVSLAQNHERIDRYALERMYGDLMCRKVTRMDSEMFFEALVGDDFEIPYVDGFLYSAENFQIEIRGATVRSTIFNMLSLSDYKTYLLINKICSQQTKNEFGYFDRELVVNQLNGVIFGPLNVLVAYETHLWSVDTGMRNSLVELEGVSFRYNPEQLFRELAGKLQTPDREHSAWVLNLGDMLGIGVIADDKKTLWSSVG